MYISKETYEQIHPRLLKVLARAEIKIFEEEYAFEEFAEEKFPFQARSEALVFVRDGKAWSQLLPSKDPAKERFRIFKINFKEALDNSGFIGWLATHLKLKIGTGVFIICGQNERHGGIFDYWGCPLEVGELVKREIKNLIEEFHAQYGE